MLQLEQWSIPDAMPAPPDAGNLHIWMLEPDMIAVDLGHLLSADELARRHSMVRETDRRRFGNTRGCLRFILAAYLGIPPQTLRFHYGAKGKPQLTAPPVRFHFNLSHSGSRALLAVSAEAPVGIDLERELMRDNLRKVAHKLFGAEWLQGLGTLDEPAFRRAFFTRWTAHEARVKAIGEGVFSHDSRLPDIPCVQFTPLDGWCAAIAVDGQLPGTERWGTYRFAPDLLSEMG